MPAEELLRAIQDIFRAKDHRFTVHGLQEALAEEFSPENVRDAIISQRAELLEDYPDDARGASCLVLGWTSDGRAVHTVVTHPPIVAVVTVYAPREDKWIDFRTRR